MYAPAWKLTGRAFRSLLQRARKNAFPSPLFTPYADHWHTRMLPAPRGDLQPGQHWSWIHCPWRPAKWRLLHFLIVHGAVAVNVRLSHTIQDYRHCEGAPHCLADETVRHLFFECPIVRDAWPIFDDYVKRCFATAPNDAPPPARRGVAQYILTDLAFFARPGSPIFVALNIGQACMLQAIWTVRNEHKFDGFPFTAEVIAYTFITLVRNQLLRIARALPSYMRDYWAPPNNTGLFRADRRTFALVRL